jgi:tol-pal system protein YbgF
MSDRGLVRWVRARVPRRAARLALAALAPLATGACFATRNDVRVLQQDLLAARSEAARIDSARARQLDAAIARLGAVSDSLRALGARDARFQGDVRDRLHALGEQIIQVQELTGQSQRRLQELRASLEPRAEAAAAAASGDTSTASGEPGPNQLYELALDQFRRGSFATARAGFEDLLRRFPSADVADDAQFYVAESLAAAGSAAAADSAYRAVVTRYPASPRAATALYKRARTRAAAGRRAEARTLYEELVRRFPRSDEAELARGALREQR